MIKKEGFIKLDCSKYKIYLEQSIDQNEKKNLADIEIFCEGSGLPQNYCIVKYHETGYLIGVIIENNIITCWAKLDTFEEASEAL